MDRLKSLGPAWKYLAEVAMRTPRAFIAATAFAALLVLGSGCASTRVPDLLEQGRSLAAQAVSAVDVSDDGRSVAVTTLAFRHDWNFWVLSGEGEVLFGRNIAPWAPFQAAALDNGKGFGVGLAYSRVTPPFPTISLFGSEKGEETVLEDSYGDRGWLRYGEGDWRTGWLRSLLGDLIVRAGNSVITVRGHNGSMKLGGDGQPQKHALKYDRPYRMSASVDGHTLALGYIVPDLASADSETKKTLRTPPPLVTVTEASSGAELWKFTPTEALSALPKLPEPGQDLPGLAATFNLRPDAVVPFRVASSVSPNPDGTTIALADYGGWLWVRRSPAIGKWDPPYHVIPFVPRQRGTLRIVTSPGTETARAEFPQDGLFEVVSDPKGATVWAVPMSWFARGMAGSAWLPGDADARTIYEFDVARKTWRTAWEFPDAVSDFALRPDGQAAWVSCWDGRLYFVQRDGRAPVEIDAGGPARLKWSKDGGLAVAGTERGEVLGLDGSGKLRWRVKLPVAEPPAPEAAKPVFEGIPVYSVGRTGKEHAYVGDTWLIKTGAGGILVDAGGSSSIPSSLRRISAAGVDPKDVHHLLHTHSHGDHCGAAYLWRSMGLKIVAPESASFALSWLMPMLTDYGVWVPRPVDIPLPLKRAGDETEITLAGLKIRAVFVPGHSMDSVIYMMELGGKRIVFTGDVGFQAPSDILHRCWTDVEKAAVVTEIVKTKVIPFRPEVVFTGHGGRAEGTAFLEDLVKRSEESIQKARAK
jgi:glyoxylase-like metal-dependent hydrolase (beta-lactamase superfamily II)